MTDYSDMLTELRESDARAAGRLTRRMMAENREMPIRRCPWTQEAEYDTTAPGVAVFGITSTVDRRSEFLAALAKHCPGDRDAVLRNGLRRKAEWESRFTSRTMAETERAVARRTMRRAA